MESLSLRLYEWSLHWNCPYIFIKQSPKPKAACIPDYRYMRCFVEHAASSFAAFWFQYIYIFGFLAVVLLEKKQMMRGFFYVYECTLFWISCFRILISCFLRKNKGGDLFFTCISIGVLCFCWSCAPRTFAASKRHKSRSRKTNSKPACQHVIYRRLELDRFSDSVYGHLNSLPKKKKPFGTTVLHAQGAATEAAPATGREMEVAAR